MTAADRERLALFRLRHKVAETAVIGYALERLFTTFTDEELARVLSDRGAKLRRPNRST
jgi:hypothetical protein